MKLARKAFHFNDVAVIVGALGGLGVAIALFYLPRFWASASVLTDAGLSQGWAVGLTGVVYGVCVFGVIRGVRRDDPGWPGFLFFAGFGYPIILFVSSAIASTAGVPLIAGFGILVGGFVFMFLCMAIGAKIQSFRS